mgnify:CR=1 FL=1|tara:strand:+ start:480 stop:674 length:195 start_codon:yes stop_codon:yes gene_type:complete
MKMKNNHELQYPEQYNHPLCGKTVKTESGESFVVFRVVNSRFGQLAMSEENQKESFAVRTLETQ